AAVLARPVDADPAAVGELALPGAQERDLGGERRGRGRIAAPPRRQVCLEPSAQLGAKRFLGRAEGQVHARQNPKDRSPRMRSTKSLSPSAQADETGWTRARCAFRASGSTFLRSFRAFAARRFADR